MHHRYVHMGKKRQRRPKHVPQRTCVVCHQKMDKRRLTRVVRTKDEGVVVDPTGKRNGRGAYLCDQPECWDKVSRNIRLLNQALMAEMDQSDLDAISAHRPVSK